MFVLYLLLGVYLAAINIYAFLHVRSCKKAERDHGKKTGNGRLFVAGLLGGAVTAYIAMFALKCKTDELLPMTVLPLLAVLNGLLVFALVRGAMLAFA